MKNYLHYVLGLLIGTIMTGTIFTVLKEENDSRRLRRERDMYDSLYRTANTKLINFQDSINKHCICK